MNITSLREIITGLWDFIFPPIITAFLLFLISYTVMGSRIFAPFKAAAVYGFELLENDDARKLIDFYA
jgi:hypothetical protein